MKTKKENTKLKIGSKEYKFKKDAITHYRQILNSYEFDQSLNDDDFNGIIDLLDYYYFNQLTKEDHVEEILEVQISSEEINEIDGDDDFEIVDVKVSRVQFNTKCFEVFFDDGSSQYISYLMILRNKKYSQADLFYIACRNSIHDDIRTIKQEYFDKHSVNGKVKCQETGLLSIWEELVVDHRQPNTFSIIVDRFKEVSGMDVRKLEFMSDEQNHIVFKDSEIAFNFKNYHKGKANLRVVRKECNASRTGMARVKTSSKDLIIK